MRLKKRGDNPFPNTEKDIPNSSKVDVKEVALLLKERFKEEERTRRYASIKKVLLGLAIAGSIPVVLAAPKTAIVVKALLDELTKEEKEDWRKYNLSYLSRTLNSLSNGKLVEVKETGKEAEVIITEKGRRKILKYGLEEIKIPQPKTWDKKWRLIIFDVPEKMRLLRNNFRDFVKKLGLLRIQQSVYLYPFPCKTQIEFLREYFGVGSFIIYAIVGHLENDEPYRKYFGL